MSNPTITSASPFAEIKNHHPRNSRQQKKTKTLRKVAAPFRLSNKVLSLPVVPANGCKTICDNR